MSYFTSLPLLITTPLAATIPRLAEGEVVSGLLKTVSGGNQAQSVRLTKDLFHDLFHIGLKLKTLIISRVK